MKDYGKCDFANPESVVSAFIRSMHRWEIESAQARRSARKTKDPASYQASVEKKMKEIFQIFCTPKERSHGRLGSFQIPPEYDPEKEKILKQKEDGSRSEVDTEREAILGGGRYRYVLKKNDGSWNIDSLKFNDQGKWIPATL